MARLAPRIGVKDLERELKFFNAVGFETVDRQATGALVRFEDVELRVESFESFRVSDGPLLDWDRSPPQLGTGVQLYVTVDNVDDIVARLPVGVPRPWPPQDKKWGMRELTLRSPSGYLLTFAQPVAR